MAVVRVTSIHRYVGASGDSKPTTGVPAGSEFFESDTGLTYVFNGEATWTLRLSPATEPA